MKNPKTWTIYPIEMDLYHESGLIIPLRQDRESSSNQQEIKNSDKITILENLIGHGIYTHLIQTDKNPNSICMACKGGR